MKKILLLINLLVALNSFSQTAEESLGYFLKGLKKSGLVKIKSSLFFIKTNILIKTGNQLLKNRQLKL